MSRSKKKCENIVRAGLPESSDFSPGVTSQTHRSWMVDAAICIAIALFTLIPYAQTLNFDFVNFDDPAYVYDHALVRNGLSWKSLMDATFGFHQANWHPLVWYSYMVEVQMFGMDPGVMHGTNVVLHIANSLLLYLWLRLATCDKYRSLLAALFFSIHPAHVESVAWITERKDVLSTLFLFLTLICYTRYIQTSRKRWYGAALVSFAVGLTAKAMLVTVPVLLLLVEVWPIQRPQQTTLISSVVSVLKKRRTVVLPFLILSLTVCVITLAAQKSAGAVSGLKTLSIDQRIANAVVSYARYCVMTIWPSNLAVFYPMPVEGWQGGVVALSAIFLFTITFGSLAKLQTHPAAAVGWIWFVLTLLPVIGLVQVGIQAMADRYTYVPMVGLSLMLLWSLPNRWFRLSLPQLASLWVPVVILTGMSVRQVTYWQNSITLLSHSLEVAPDRNFIAYHNLPLAYNGAGQYQESVAVLQKGLQNFKTDPGLWFKLGNAMRSLSKDVEAIECFRTALKYNPNDSEANNNLGLLLCRSDNTEGMKYIRRAIEMNPTNAQAHNNLGNALVRDGALHAALASYAEAIRLGDLKEAKDNQQAIQDALDAASEE